MRYLDEHEERSKAAKNLNKYRWDKATQAERSAHARRMSHAFWDRLSPEERSAVMRERAARRANR